MKVSGLVAWTAIPRFLSAVCGDVVGKTRGTCCVPGLCPEHSHVVGFRPNSDIAPRGAEGGRQCSPAARPMTRCSSVCRTLRARGWTGCKSSARQMTRCGGPGIQENIKVSALLRHRSAIGLATETNLQPSPLSVTLLCTLGRRCERERERSTLG
jgi:hypothetical protein